MRILNNFYITKTGSGNNPLPVLVFETYYLMGKEENLNPCLKLSDNVKRKSVFLR